MISTPTSRPLLSLEHLTAALSPENPTGPFLRYEPIYDQIREARREEDNTLSQGIWQTDVKRADWLLVEALCVEVLHNQSKDLQIAAWLTDAWTVLDHLKGATQGLILMQGLCTTHWLALHPAILESDPETIEYRLSLFEWMDEQLAKRLLFIPLTYCEAGENLSGLTLASWLEATNLEVIAKRSPEGKNILAQAEAKGKITLTRFRKSLELTSLPFLEDTLSQVAELQDTLTSFCQALESVLHQQAPNFSKIKHHLDDISRLIKTSCQQKRQEAPKIIHNTEAPLETSVEDLLKPDQESLEGASEKTPDTVTISERQDAYRALQEISMFLKALDAHSPAPALLDLIVSWQNKSLVEILSDVSKGTQEGHVFLRLLANASQTLPMK